MLTPKDYEKLNQFYEENEVFRELFQAIEKDHMLSLSKISHEIRNPVTLINGFLQLMAADHPEVHTWRYWNDIMENMAFLRELLTELSQYNNAGTLHCSEASPYQILNSVITSLVPSLSEKNITVSFKKLAPVPTFMVDGTKLKEVFLNLFRNAAEAMPEGGRIMMLLPYAVMESLRDSRVSEASSEICLKLKMQKCCSAMQTSSMQVFLL